MNSEKRFFLQVLKDHLAGEKTKVKEDIDWSIITSLARSHQVEGIMYYQCKEFMPDVVRTRFEEMYLSTLFYFKNREANLNTIIKLFTENDIPCFTIKGLGVSYCYPIPPLRTMGDIDLVVHRDNKEKAGEILELNGFSLSVKTPDNDWVFYQNGMHYELHHQLLYNESANIPVQVDFFNNCWQFVDNGTIDWSFHFLFLLAHLRKHLLNSGAGFRMFMDIATVIQAKPELNWKWIEYTLDHLGMKRFSSNCFCLVETWFGIKAPIQYKVLDDSIVEHATERIFENGIFGFDDDNNRKNVAIYKMIKNGKARNYSRGIMTLRYLFPKYIHMRYIPYYNFIEGHPWLTPVAWIYRVIRMITGKENGIKQFIKDINIPDQELDSREKELKLWGLIE